MNPASAEAASMNAPIATAHAAAEAARPEPPADIRGLFAGLILVLTLGALDQNIVVTALPRIVSDLGAISHLTWVVTSYIVTATMATPLYGKLSDQYGRRPLLYAAIGIFLVGSVLAGLSQTMTELIVFRAVQGLGAGGLLPLAQITIGDVISPRERGRYQGVFTAVFAVCSIAGPLLGSLLTRLEMPPVTFFYVTAIGPLLCAGCCVVLLNVLRRTMGETDTTAVPTSASRA